jgi:hypothetical protein
MVMPYYKVMPFLPMIEGHITDSNNKEPIENAVIYWKNDKANNIKVSSNSEGYFRIEQINKYIKWKIVVMDSAWGGIVYIKKDGYKEKEINVGGMKESFQVDIELEKIE